MTSVLQSFPATSAIATTEGLVSESLRARNIAVAIRQRLTRSPYGAWFSEVSYRQVDGRVTLRGTVSSYFLKQMLQEALRGIEQFDSLENEVDVLYETKKEFDPNGN